MIKSQTEYAFSFPGTMLTAAIMLAQIDTHGLLDYGLKAGIGGAVWLIYKVIADRFDRKNRKTVASGKAKQTSDV